MHPVTNSVEQDIAEIKGVLNPYLERCEKSAYFSKKLLNERILLRNPWKYWNFSTARLVLCNPEVVLRGPRLDANNQPIGWCYTGLPDNVRSELGGIEPCPDGMVFVAYLNEDNHLFEWRLEKADKIEIYLPYDYRKRFPGGLTWTRQS